MSYCVSDFMREVRIHEDQFPGRWPSINMQQVRQVVETRSETMVHIT